MKVKPQIALVFAEYWVESRVAGNAYCAMFPLVRFCIPISALWRNFIWSYTGGMCDAETCSSRCTAVGPCPRDMTFTAHQIERSQNGR